ncbi:uncharacterized protein MONOS_7977 [Monocercomonoides exilis]|uniref:uncharacterized protein n=1 Tax=Monocercomonoides exilis TaxID=2049356 RepID=UPI003559CA14|nr:hypothetical protein MONOS_7977 [Monocercomonoides exilis]
MRKAKSICLEKLSRLDEWNADETDSFSFEEENEQTNDDIHHSDIDSETETTCSFSCKDLEKEQNDSKATERQKEELNVSNVQKKRKVKAKMVNVSSNQCRILKLRKKCVLDDEEHHVIVEQKLKQLEQKKESIKDIDTFDENFRIVKSLNDLYGKMNTKDLSPLPQASSYSNSALSSPRYVYDSPTLFSDVLRTFSKEELTPYTEEGLPFKEETIKSHLWAFRMYIDYCKSFHKQAWPLQPDAMYGFIKLLGIAVGYSFETVCGSIKYALYAISETRTGEPVSSKVKLKVSRAENEILIYKEKRRKKGLPTSLHENDVTKWQKHPLIVSDLQWILDCYPDWVIEKPREASLFLFAMSTGARAQTCSQIKLKDIIRVVSMPNTTFVKVTFNLECTKTASGDDHCVTIEGNIAEKNNMNVIWWLEQFLTEEYGLSLTRFNKWDLKELEYQKLWNLRKGAMRVRLQKRASMAGYPERLFGFHSFRSGFMCSALMKGGKDTKQRESVIEATALVGNWMTGSPSQWDYIKEVEKSTIVSNRLVLPKELLESDEYFDESLTHPKVYHNIEMKEPSWTESSIISSFDFYVLEIIKAACSEQHYPYSCVTRLNRMAARAFLHERNVQYSSKESVMKLSREEILKTLLIDKNVTSAVKIYIEGIKDYLNGDKRLIFKKPKRKVLLRENRPVNAVMGTKSRRRWTVQEDKILMKMFLQHKPFQEISKKLTDRTWNSCRDRIINITKNQANYNFTKRCQNMKNMSLKTS